MVRHRAELKLGESWVVEGEEDDHLADGEPSYLSASPGVTDSSFASSHIASSPEMPSTRSRTRLNETQDSTETAHSEDDATPLVRNEEAHTPLDQTPRTKSRKDISPEPQLIMPELDNASMDGSWTKSRRSPHIQRSRRISSHSPDIAPRRRVNRPSLAPESPSKHAPTRKSPRLHSHPPPSSKNQLQGPPLIDAIFNHFLDIWSGMWSILIIFLRFLKVPISVFLAIWLLAGSGIFLRNLITTSISNSLSPICRLPGASLLNLPFCPKTTYTKNDEAVEFDTLMNLQGKFEEVLDESTTGVSLPMDMKRGESSIRDLRQLVRYSALPSRNELVLEFDSFIETARIASYDLQKFNSHIGRAVDSVLSTTRWTSKVLQGISDREASASVVEKVSALVLLPFQPVKYSESALLDQYIQHTTIIEGEIRKLIDEAQALLLVLNNLENRLDVIHDISTRDGVHALHQRDEILSELWTMVGGNKGKLSKTTRQLSLLRQVGMYRKTAWTHVSTTIVKLQAIESGLEDLRERVGAPELLRDSGRKNVPLSVHIENIQRGVERLEGQRDENRKIENEVIRKALERGSIEDAKVIDDR